MRVLVIRARYRQLGGEDVSARLTVGAMRLAGWDVRTETAENAETGGLEGVVSSLGGVYSRQWYARIARAINEFRPDLCHVHNTFPFMTASVLQACADAGQRTLVTLHNYRTTCCVGTHMRGGRGCELCANGARVMGVLHRCYRASAPMSLAASAAGSSLLRVLASEPVRRCVIVTSPSQYACAEIERLSRGRLHPVLLQDVVEVDDSGSDARRGVLWVGRMSEEKDPMMIAKAISLLGGTSRPSILFVGDGPLRPSTEVLCERLGVDATFAGQLDSRGVSAAMHGAQLLCVTSSCPETFGRTVAEGAVHRIPTLVSNMGALPETLGGASFGWIVEQNTPECWARAIDEVLASPDLGSSKSQKAFVRACDSYSPAAYVARVFELSGAAR